MDISEIEVGKWYWQAWVTSRPNKVKVISKSEHVVVVKIYSHFCWGEAWQERPEGIIAPLPDSEIPRKKWWQFWLRNP